METALAIRAAESDIGDAMRAEMRGEGAFEIIGDRNHLFGVKRACQGEVETEFLHDIGVAPTREERVLRRRKPLGAALGEFSLSGGRAEGVERFNQMGGGAHQGGRRCGWGEGEETADPLHLKARQIEGGKRCGGGLRGLEKSGFAVAICQPEGGFEGGVKAILARAFGDLGQREGGGGMGHGFARENAPAKPSGAERGEGAGWWGPVEGVAVEGHRGRGLVWVLCLLRSLSQQREKGDLVRQASEAGCAPVSAGLFLGSAVVLLFFAFFGVMKGKDKNLRPQKFTD